MKFGKIAMLSKEIKEDIDKKIKEKFSQRFLRKYIIKECNIPVKDCPSLSQLREYIIMQKLKFQEEEKNRQKVELLNKEIIEGMSNMGLKSISLNDKKILLDNILQKCNQRIIEIEKTQMLEGNIKISLENILIRYLEFIKGIIETTLKVSNELAEDNKRIFKEVFDENVIGIFQTFHRIIMKVCPQYKEAIGLEFAEQIKIFAKEFKGWDKVGPILQIDE